MANNSGNGMQTWIVQSRLPGVQGTNGCWSDDGVFDAPSAAEALRLYCESTNGRWPRNEFRVAPAPEWQKFWPRAVETRTIEIEVG